MRIQADQSAGHGLEVTSDEQAQAMLQQVAGAIGATNPEILQSAIAAWSAHALGDAGAMLLASTLQKVAGALESAGAERPPPAAAVDGAKATKAAKAARKPKAAGVVKKAKAPKGKAPKAAGKSRAIKTHTVKSGDTLWDIARKSGVSLQSLIAANRQIKNPDLIFPGDKIKIPKGGRPAAGGGDDGPDRPAAPSGASQAQQSNPAQQTGRPRPSVQQRPEPEAVGGSSVKGISPQGRKQMATLLKNAKAHSGGKPAKGWCLREVGDILDKTSYGKIGRGKFPRLPYARNFAEYLNEGQRWKSLGLKKLKIDNPYDAPPGAIVVVRAGTPGTSHPTAGDIAIAAGGGRFLNDGEMGYGGSGNFRKGNNYVLGVYVPA